MEQLPDDVLVMVMEYLDVEDLFTCRLVCKRLGGLAVQPAVWRSREITCNDVMGARVLRVAPCLRLLRADLTYSRWPLTYISTRCAVSHLRLHLRAREQMALAAMVIRQQQLLGRLKELTVAFIRISDRAGDDTRMLLVTIASTPALEGLTVAGLPACGPALENFAAHFTVSAPSLKRFHTILSAESHAFCKLILAQHVATLEHVDLGRNKCSGIECFASIAGLLAAMPNLRKLRCRMYPGLETVASCKTLRELTIVVRPEDQDGVEAAAMLLSRSHQLRAVTLDYYCRAASPEDCGVGLVMALASARPLCLESLSITNGLFGEVKLPQPLLSALPFMPALRHLEVEPAPTRLLLGINPTSAPALQTLAVTWTAREEKYGDQCGHSYLHWITSKTLLTENPSLQLFVPNANFSYDNPSRRGQYYCERNSCRFCALGCHQGMKAFEGQYRERRKMMLIPRHIPE